MAFYIPLFFDILIRAIDFLINHVVFHHRVGNGKFDWVSRGGTSDGQGDECAICLSKVEDDDEIWELRCDHLFHRSCLDMWISYRHTTCPLCRDNLMMPPKIDGVTVCENINIGSSSQQQVLFFGFCDGGSSNDDDGTWWLR